MYIAGSNDDAGCGLERGDDPGRETLFLAKVRAINRCFGRIWGFFPSLQEDIIVG